MLFIVLNLELFQELIDARSLELEKFACHSTLATEDLFFILLSNALVVQGEFWQTTQGASPEQVRLDWG